jgi:hypothetical protein
MKKKFALIGLVAASAMLIGCSSTQCRDGGTCGDKEACCGTCGGECGDKACNHANSTFECPNCEPGKPCCADCAKKMAEMCPDCASHAKTCGPDCKKPCCAS